MADPACPGILYAIIWFLLAIFIGWPIAGILAGFYVFLLPFAACIAPLAELLDAMLKIIKLPYYWMKKCIRMNSLSDCALVE
ncbi:hypothetical protein AAHC03_05153 [Spirometra sp. Aus1]